jgi:hypothetical protein
VPRAWRAHPRRRGPRPGRHPPPPGPGSAVARTCRGRRRGGGRRQRGRGVGRGRGLLRGQLPQVAVRPARRRLPPRQPRRARCRRARRRRIPGAGPPRLRRLRPRLMRTHAPGYVLGCGSAARVPRAACTVPRAACRVPRAACRVPRAACRVLRAACRVGDAGRSMTHRAGRMMPVGCAPDAQGPAAPAKVVCSEKACERVARPAVYRSCPLLPRALLLGSRPCFRSRALLPLLPSTQGPASRLPT